jgi:hypothetical protein
VNWVVTEICERFGNARNARELWGTGFLKVAPQEGPVMTDIVVADFLEEKRMFLCRVDFVFREQ